MFMVYTHTRCIHALHIYTDNTAWTFAGKVMLVLVLVVLDAGDGIGC